MTRLRRCQPPPTQPRATLSPRGNNEEDLAAIGYTRQTRAWARVFSTFEPNRRDETRAMRAADALCEALKSEGVKHVFGIPGGANLPTYDALYDADIRHIQVRHEQGGGHAAEGYAKASGKVGVAFATSGPGATNMVTAIADAIMDSVPTVFITGQVRSELIGTDGFQEADISGITMPIVKHSIMIQDPRYIPRALHEAFHIARSARGM